MAVQDSLIQWSSGDFSCTYKNKSLNDPFAKLINYLNMLLFSMSTTLRRSESLAVLP